MNCTSEDTQLILSTFSPGDTILRVMPSTRSCAQAYGLCAGTLMLVLLIGMPLQLRSFPGGLAITEVLLIGLPAILFVCTKRLPMARALMINRVSAGVVVRSLVLGITGWGMAGALYLFISRPLLGPEPAFDAAAPHTLPELLVRLGVGAVLPGICEELLFRGAIFGVLQRKGNGKAIIISAALFAGYHLNPWNLLPIFALGLLLGVLRARTGSILPGMIAHISVNAMAFTISYLARGTSDEGFPMRFVVILGVLFFLAFAEFIRGGAQIEHGSSPLAAVPAGGMWRICVAAALVFVLFVVGVRLCLRGFPAQLDQPELNIHRGDLVLVAKTSLLPLRIDPGDRICLRENQRGVFHRVVRIEKGELWVDDQTSNGETGERATARKSVIGKVVYVMPMPIAIGRSR